MDRQWLPLNALRAFRAASSILSFTAAANSLTVAQSAVSRHVIDAGKIPRRDAVERRPPAAGPDRGRQAPPARRDPSSFDRIDQRRSARSSTSGAPKRVLGVENLPPTFAHQLAIPILRDFRAEHPGISLEIVSKPTAGPKWTAISTSRSSIPKTSPRLHEPRADFVIQLGEDAPCWLQKEQALPRQRLTASIQIDDPGTRMVRTSF